MFAKVLEFADLHASKLLSSDSLARCDLAVLQRLLSRSTLHIKSETEVAAALARSLCP